MNAKEKKLNFHVIHTKKTRKSKKYSKKSKETQTVPNRCMKRLTFLSHDISAHAALENNVKWSITIQMIYCEIPVLCSISSVKKKTIHWLKYKEEVSTDDISRALLIWLNCFENKLFLSRTCVLMCESMCVTSSTCVKRFFLTRWNLIKS